MTQVLGEVEDSWVYGAVVTDAQVHRCKRRGDARACAKSLEEEGEISWLLRDVGVLAIRAGEEAAELHLLGVVL